MYHVAAALAAVLFFFDAGTNDQTLWAFRLHGPQDSAKRMTLPAAIVLHAKASGDLTAIFADRIYPVVAPQGAKPPLLIFRRVGLAFETTIGTERRTLARARYRFFSEADPQDHRRAYLGIWRVYEAFHGLAQMVLGGEAGLPILQCLAQDTAVEAQEEYVPLTDDSGIVSVPMEFEFLYDLTKELL